MRSAYVLMALACWVPAAAGAQQVRVGGQIRPRYEYRDPGVGPADAFTSMRVRAELAAQLERGISAFVQIQDVRLFGEARSTTADARTANLGLQQGYADLVVGAGMAVWGRVGRQSASFGEERLVGALDWVQQGRSFDGARAGVRLPFGTADLFGFKIAEGTAPGAGDDAEFGGGYAQFTRFPLGTLDTYALLTRVPAVGTNQGTLGARLAGRRGMLEYRVEGAYQLGERGDLPVRAFLGAAQATLAVANGRARITLWYDHLSGDDAPADGTVRVFETILATNHKFYGYADLFTDLPAHTGNRGLRDAAVKMALTPVAPLAFALDGHAFRVANATGLASGRLGEEVDLTATWKYSVNAVVTGGASWVADGPQLRALGRLRGDLLFTYLMLDVKF